MKKIISLIMSVFAFFVACADDAFTFVTDGNYGYSYIQINQDLDSFSFKSDWHSLGNAGKVGYVVYTADMSDSDRAAYIEANANNPEFRKSVNGGVLDLGSLKAGDRVGFYEVRPNGGTYTQSAFKDWQNKTWINPSEYDPSALIQGGASFMFANAIGVSLVVIAVFLPLTVTIFNKSDVK